MEINQKQPTNELISRNWMVHQASQSAKAIKSIFSCNEILAPKRNFMKRIDLMLADGLANKVKYRIRCSKSNAGCLIQLSFLNSIEQMKLIKPNSIGLN